MQLFNVNWKLTPLRQTTPAGINHVLDVIEGKLGLTRTFPQEGKKLITSYDALRGHYFIQSRTGNDITVFAYIVTDEIFMPIRFSTTYASASENVNGAKAAQEMFAHFTRKTGRRFPDVYGADPDRDDLFWKIKSCVPAPISYADDMATGYIIKNCVKADVSSAFPYEASKSMPTLKGAITVQGRVPPSEEYPFAFYPFDGTLAIFGEFDSKYFFNHRAYKYDGYPDPPYPAVETILCKKADDNGALSDIFETKYGNRVNHPRNKSTMNSFIGFWHMRSRPAYSHMAAVVLARCNHRMFSLMSELENRGQDPILVNCDSIMWVGEAQPDLTSHVKKLGAFYEEGTEIEAAISSSKKYQLRYSDGTVKTVWSGIKKEYTSQLEFGNILYNDRPAEIVRLDDEINRLKIYEVDEFWQTTNEGRIAR